MSRPRARLSNERGAILPWFAIWLPVLVLFVVLVVDVANWFEHKRHLQMQADAAALAGAGKFRLPIAFCDDAAVKNEARKYAGNHLDGSENAWTALYNHQVGGTPVDRLHGLINFEPDDPSRFWRGSADDDGASPCASRFIEVKLTERDLPWFFGVPPLAVPWIDARARVSLKQLGVGTNLVPIAVPDVDPSTVTATFVNECTGATIATAPLAKSAALDAGMAVWANNGTGLPGDPGAVAVPMPTTCTRVGVRVAIGTNTTSTSCSHPLVDCFDLGSANGLLLVRSSPTGGIGTPATPVLRDVELLPAAVGCTDGSFFTMETPPLAKPCTGIGVRAKIDFGLLGPAVNTKVEAEYQVGNTPKRKLTYDAGADVWTTPSNEFLNPNTGPGSPFTGPIPVKLIWCVSPGGSGCGGNAPYLEGGAVVQRSFGGVDNRSGPIKLVQTFDAGGARASSFAAGSSPSLIVRVVVLSNHRVAQSVSDPIVVLRVRGNQNQALNCDVDFTNLSDELAYGCGQRLPPASPTSPFAEAYEKNDGTVDCRTTHRTVLWSWAAAGQSNPPWPCVAIKTGHSPNEIPQGLNMRILGSAKPSVCPGPGSLGHNNWAMFDDPDGLPAGDPRIVQVVLTPFGAFSGTGNDGTVPVTGFATFYITGWTGQGSGFDNPCQGAGDDPVPGNDSGLVVGHFITYIESVNSGATDLPCDESSLTPCVAVLTD